MQWSTINHHIKSSKSRQVDKSQQNKTESNNNIMTPNQSLNLRLQPIAEIAPAIQALTNSELLLHSVYPSIQTGRRSKPLEVSFTSIIINNKQLDIIKSIQSFTNQHEQLTSIYIFTQQFQSSQVCNHQPHSTSTFIIQVQQSRLMLIWYAPIFDT
jgi:hypothetical protein